MGPSFQLFGLYGALAMLEAMPKRPEVSGRYWPEPKSPKVKAKKKKAARAAKAARRRNRKK